jgi:hypothetical protein
MRLLSSSRQVARAWVLLLLGFTVFSGLFALAVTTGYTYVRDSTQTQTAIVEPVSGSSLVIRSMGQEDWRLVTEPTVVNEGDQISAGSGTVGWVTFFDQSTLEISENSMLRVNRMRTSRMVQDNKEIEIEPIRGSIYVSKAPRGEYTSSVLHVRSGPATVRMRDDIRADETGSFLLETQRVDPSGDETSPILSVRTAVLRGVATVETERGSRNLSADEQVVIDAAGHIGELTPALRELIRNGDFARELSDWVEFHDQPGDPVRESGSIDRVSTEQGESGVALQISRSTQDGDSWETGVEQTIGQSLRVHSSLNLRFNVRIDDQQPPGGGDEQTEFPLIAKLEYVDVQGQQREWWHGVYILEDPQNPVPEETATLIDRGEWTELSLDLRELQPLPMKISSLTIYSSGHNYRTHVTNISLTSSETGDDRYD